MLALPEAIRAVQIQHDRTVAVVDIPFASQEKIRSLPDGHVLVRVRAVDLRLPIPKSFTTEAAAFKHQASSIKHKGEKIRVWGASTAVSHHAIQLAALSGLGVYAIASPAAHITGDAIFERSYSPHRNHARRICCFLASSVYGSYITIVR